MDMLKVSVNSPGNRWSQSWRRKGRLRLEGFAEKEGFNNLEWKSEGWWIMDDDSGESSGTNRRSATHRTVGLSAV